MNYCLFASKQGLLFESHALFEGVNIIGMGVNIVRICRENLIPYYKRGKHLFFKRLEIETRMSDTRNKTDEEVERDAMEYCAKHPIGSGRRR